VVRFEYVSRDADPDLSYSRNQVQFHEDFDRVIHNFSPSKLHIPTGWVTVESVVRFLLTDLKVKSLRPTWEKILADSEKQFVSGPDELLPKGVPSRPALPCTLDRESASADRICPAGDSFLKAFP
jgi:hypothetical protein